MSASQLLTAGQLAERWQVRSPTSTASPAKV